MVDGQGDSDVAARMQHVCITLAAGGLDRAILWGPRISSACFRRYGWNIDTLQH
jgi:hypothetical protein